MTLKDLLLEKCKEIVSILYAEYLFSTSQHGYSIMDKSAYWCASTQNNPLFLFSVWGWREDGSVQIIIIIIKMYFI